jgi:hypothetical protein
VWCRRGLRSDCTIRGDITSPTVSVGSTTFTPSLLRDVRPLTRMYALRRMVWACGQRIVDLNPTHEGRVIAAARRQAPIAMGPYAPEVLSYELVRTVLRHPRFITARGLGPDLQGITSGALWERTVAHILSLDGPAHHWLRRLVCKAFAPRGAERLRALAVEVISELVDPLTRVGRRAAHPANAYRHTRTVKLPQRNATARIEHRGGHSRQSRHQQGAAVSSVPDICDDAHHDEGVSPHAAKRLRDAMDRLLAGHPQRSDGRLIKDNLWKEAGLSLA